MPDGERVTTGSEPRRHTARREDGRWLLIFTRSGYFADAARDEDHAENMRDGGWDVVEVVEPGHDEQTEDVCANCGKRRNEHIHAGNGGPDMWCELGPNRRRFSSVPDPWQPDPRTVAAVVEALRDFGVEARSDEQALDFFRVADFIESHPRFKPSAPGGTNAVE